MIVILLSIIEFPSNQSFIDSMLTFIANDFNFFIQMFIKWIISIDTTFMTFFYSYLNLLLNQKSGLVFQTNIYTEIIVYLVIEFTVKLVVFFYVNNRKTFD